MKTIPKNEVKNRQQQQQPLIPLAWNIRKRQRACRKFGNPRASASGKICQNEEAKKKYTAKRNDRHG